MSAKVKKGAGGYFGECLASFVDGDRDGTTMRFAWPAPPYIVLPALSSHERWSCYRLERTTPGKGKRPYRALYEATA